MLWEPNQKDTSRWSRATCLKPPQRALVLERTDTSVYFNTVVLLDEPARRFIEKMKGGNV